MKKKDVIESISAKGNGEIYLGVVGAVRSGKSTFIKKCIENLVVPNIEEEIDRKRCLDEIPQSASGKQIMTIEPKFVPSSGANIKIDELETKIKMVDCVGYIIDESLGYEDEFGNPRMIKTPWYEEEIPFVEAAELGTEKVIRDHSTIGIVMTTDGSIGEFSRSNYEVVEEKVVNELKDMNKPFIVIMNTTHPDSSETISLSKSLSDRYEVPVMPISVENMNEPEIMELLKEALYEFPIEQINVNIPDWVAVLENKHWLKEIYMEQMKACVTNIDKLRDVEQINVDFETNEHIEKAYISNVNTKNGEVTINLEAPINLYDQILKDTIGVSINSKAQLLKMFENFRDGRNEFDRFKEALKQVNQTGYGIACPEVNEMKLEKPEVIKRNGRYGVKLKAVASSIHMIKVDVESSFEPIIGSEIQSKELINYLLKDQEENPDNIWKSEIFGRSLDVIVQEGIQAKLSLLPENARFKLGQTVTKMINKGSSNLIAIVI